MNNVLKTKKIHFFNKIIRIFKEWYNPDQKCQRFGHTYNIVSICQYKWPGKGIRSAADKVSYNQEMCKCCGKMGDIKEIKRESIQSLSMPSDWWNQLRKDGKFRLS
jgi:hypothetical protein